MLFINYSNHYLHCKVLKKMSLFLFLNKKINLDTLDKILNTEVLEGGYIYHTWEKEKKD